MNRSLSLVLKVWEAEAPGAGMNMIFRDILEALVKRNILSERDRKKIWEAWGKWRGRLEEFITEVFARHAQQPAVQGSYHQLWEVI